MIFPNIESWDEGAQKQKFIGIIDSHNLKYTTNDQYLPKAQINMTYQPPSIKAINGLQKELNLPLVPEQEIVPEFSKFCSWVGFTNAK